MKHKIFSFILILIPMTLFTQSFNSIPNFTIPATKAQWQKQRKKIRLTLETLLGNIPQRPKVPMVHILSRENKGKYVFEKFEFENGDKATVSGYLLIPNDGKAQHPAIFYSHWHGGNYDLGKDEIFQTHHTPEVPADALIRSGFAVMAIDAYCFGERQGKGQGGSDEKGSIEELTTSKYHLWQGRSLWAMMLHDDLMALDYLFSRKEIDTLRVGATGISMGATHTWWLMALDERIKTGVAVACMTRYQELIAEQKLKSHGIYYFVPGMLQHFDTEAVISLIAPHPILFMTGDQDMGSPVSGIYKIEEEVKKVYRLYKSESEFQNIIYPNIGHEYTKDMWEKMLKWFEEKLK